MARVAESAALIASKAGIPPAIPQRGESTKPNTESVPTKATNIEIRILGTLLSSNISPLPPMIDHASGTG
jgi:hypothetical protein